MHKSMSNLVGRLVVGLVNRSTLRLNALLLTAGMLGSVGGAQAQPVPPAGSPSVTLTSYADTWYASQPRWWDIASYRASSTNYYNQYNAWSYTGDATNGYSSPNFDYATAGTPGGPTVTVTYDRAPNVPYFVGRIVASNLKPNFAYQMKLVGKPVYGARGAGPFVKKNAGGAVVAVPDGGGEDWANAKIGHIGRWWNDSNASGNTNAVTDSVYASTYPTDTIYGYIFMGNFVTGPDGKADVYFTGNSNYHITFQNWQSGGDVRMVQNGLPAQQTDASGFKYFSIAGSPPTGPSYAYGPLQPSSNQAQENGYKNVYLWYQYESSMTAGRPQNVVLPPGHYNCRLMLTEESFHNNYGATNSAYGGKWESVLINEDFAKGSDGNTIYDANGNAIPDVVTSNDIVFDIKDSSGNLIAPPVAPTNMGATLNTATPGAPRAELSWSHSALPNANYYFKIKRSTTTGGPYTTVAGGVDTKTTSYTDNTISTGTNYYYVVTAVNSGVEGSPSIEVVIAGNPTPPQAPVLAGTAGDDEVNLSWNVVAGATSYKLKRSVTGGGNYETTITVTGTSYRDTNVDNGTGYFYVVSAVNNSGESANSNEVNLTPQLAPPAAPSNLSAAIASSSQINLAWVDNAGNEAGFIIERSVGDNTHFEILRDTLAPNVTAHADTGVAPGIYYYRVLAYNAAGDSAYSNVVAVNTTVVSPPAKPTGLTAQVLNGQVQLAWLASAGAVNYKVKRSTTSGSYPTSSVITSVSGTSYIDATALQGITYYYVVTAVNSGGESGSSNQASAFKPLPAPSALSARRATKTRVDLTWTDNSGNESGFKIERSTNNVSWSQIATVGANVKTYSNTGLSSRLYFYRVRAYYGSVNSSYSNTASS